MLKFFEGAYKFISEGLKENPLLVFELFVAVILGSIMAILMFYCAIALGHLSNKHKGLKAVGYYILIFIAQSIVSNIFAEIIGTTNMFDDLSMKSGINVLVLLFIIYYIFFGAIFYLVTTTILERHLNLE